MVWYFVWHGFCVGSKTSKSSKLKMRKTVTNLVSDNPVVVVELVFYGPSTHFRSFSARSVNLATLFLGKPPRQFTST